MLVKEFIEQKSLSLGVSDSVKQALQLMNIENLSQIVLLSEHSLPTILDKELLLNFDKNSLLSEVPIKHNDAYVFGELNILEIVEYLLEKGLEVCPVLDSERSFTGILRSSKIFKAVLKGQFPRQSALINLRIEKKDYSLTDISRIVESEGLKIERIHLKSENQNTYEFYITLSQNNISAVVSSLRRFGYQIEIVSNLENEFLENKDRFGLLMKYLEF